HDTIAALERPARYALVVSYGSVASYKGKPVDPHTAGHDLNVRYLAEGEIRLDGDKVVVATQMIDAATATQVRSDRMDTATTQLRTPGVVGVLAHHIQSELFDLEVRRAAQQSGPKADAVSLWLRGLATEAGTARGARAALKLYDDALKLDPKFVGALIDSAWA